MSNRLRVFFLFVLLLNCAGCANITSPTGGKKDTIPPKLVSIDPKDSLLNTRVTRIEMHFDEYITVSDVTKELQISPILTVAPTMIGKNKMVVVKIVDSLLDTNTTYRLSFGTSIRDLHEGNQFHKYTYTFSTGPYFDSLQLHGRVINAATGLPDTGSIIVVLYNGTENDSAIVRHKPRYITKADAGGNYIFKGLPSRAFHIYALKDLNANLFYDGSAAGEMVGFADSLVVPSDSSQTAINMSVFMEPVDTAIKKSIDSTKKIADSTAGKKDAKKNTKKAATDVLTYTVNLDTTNSEKRSFDINGFIFITFNKSPVLSKEKITLTYDSLGVTVAPAFTITSDTTTHRVKISSNWRENMEYKLRLVKGFAKDTSGIEVAPSKWIFRTKSAEDDYGTIHLHLPSKYNSSRYLLYIMADNDSVYLKPVTDTLITLARLKPAKYTLRIIVDKNGNGKYDTGDLLGKKQPEVVIPYGEQVPIKAGFENNIDFEPVPAPQKDKGPDISRPK